MSKPNEDKKSAFLPWPHPRSRALHGCIVSTASTTSECAGFNSYLFEK